MEQSFVRAFLCSQFVSYTEKLLKLLLLFIKLCIILTNVQNLYGVYTPSKFWYFIFKNNFLVNLHTVGSPVSLSVIYSTL